MAPENSAHAWPLDLSRLVVAVTAEEYESRIAYCARAWYIGRHRYYGLVYIYRHLVSVLGTSPKDKV